MSPDALTVLERCEALAAVSSSDTGITRVYLSPEHARVNELAGRWMEQAGMTTWLDAAGNQRGRYDGILGVLLAIAVVERLNVEGVRLPFAVEVLAFGDEEGTRFGTALLGSRAVAGTWDDAWWGLLDAEGVSLRDAFVAFGLDPEAVGDAAPPRDSVIGYLETHIEQGPYLEEADRALAVVSSIAGARRFELTMTGVAGHAGGVPFHRRHDALAGAAEVVLAVERIAREAGCIATVGRLEAFPGGVNVIPGLVEFSLDLRAEHDVRRDEVWAAIEAAAAETCSRRGLVFAAHETHSAPAVVASASLADAVRTGIVATGDAEPLTLFSKAGHDAMAIDALTDWAMLFVRCGNGGISHHPDEIVDAADVSVALDAFEAAVRELAGRRLTAVGAA